jgi:membrane protein YdbS with pleckstrin-like domain
MKNINGIASEESYPTLINESDYSVFTSDNLAHISNSSEASLTLDDLLIDQEDWGWLYSSFSRSKLGWLRRLYSIVYIFECFCFVLNFIITKDIKSPPKNIPFTLDPYFKTISWATILCLGAPFLKFLYSNSVSSINLLSWSINLLYLPVYLFLSIFFIHNTFQSHELSLIIQDATILLSIVFVLIIYSKVKYKDDGRYKVGILEFLGVQVHFSVLLACLLVEACEALFLTLGVYFDTDNKDSTIFNWPNENWTILVMTLTWWTGCLILYLYKDVFYAGLLAFTYFGIFSIQTRTFCDSNQGNCSHAVSTSGITLGSILFFFIFITIITYPRLVMYSVRRYSDH